MSEKENSEENHFDEDTEQKCAPEAEIQNPKMEESQNAQNFISSPNESPENEILSTNTNKSEFDGCERESVDISSISTRNVDAYPSEQVDEQRETEISETRELGSDAEITIDENKIRYDGFEKPTIAESCNGEENSSKQNISQTSINNLTDTNTNNESNQLQNENSEARENEKETENCENNNICGIDETKENEQQSNKTIDNSSQSIQGENTENITHKNESSMCNTKSLIQQSTDPAEFTEVELSAPTTPQNTPKNKKKKNGKCKRGSKTKTPKKAKGKGKSTSASLPEISQDEIKKDEKSIVSDQSINQTEEILSEKSITSDHPKVPEQSADPIKSEESINSTNLQNNENQITPTKDKLNQESSEFDVLKQATVNFEIEEDVEESESSEMNEGQINDIEEQLILGEPVDGLLDNQYEFIIKDLISKRDLANSTREKRCYQKAAELAANCKTAQSESIMAEDELSAAHEELAKFDSEMSEILIKMHKENDEKRARLLKAQQIQVQRLEAEWSSDAKALRYCRASSTLVKMRQNLKALRSRNMNKEADELQKIVDRTTESEQEAAGKVMQHDYDDAVQMLKARQESERDFLETQFSIHITQFERERGKMRENLMEKITKAERKVSAMSFSGIIVREKNSKAASKLDPSVVLDETMITLPTLKLRNTFSRREKTLKDDAV